MQGDPQTVNSDIDSASRKETEVVAVENKMAAGVQSQSQSQSHHGTEALSQWISDVRSKSVRMRRQRRSDLRTQAILGRALRSAEDELVSRQRERARRWARLQPLLAPPPPPPPPCQDEDWLRELQKLDDFFNDLNSVQISEYEYLQT